MIYPFVVICLFCVVGMVNLSSEKSFEICMHLLEKKRFTQYSVKKNLKSGMKIVNEIFKYLESKKIIRKSEKFYELTDSEGLCLAISYFRSMNDALLFSFNSNYSKDQLVKLMPAEIVFCLETAFEKYNNYYKSNNVFAYVNEKSAADLKKKLFVKGSKSSLFLFKKKPLLTEVQIDKKNNSTNLLRTAVDLFCDNKAELGEKLLKQFYKSKVMK